MLSGGSVDGAWVTGTGKGQSGAREESTEVRTGIRPCAVNRTECFGTDPYRLCSGSLYFSPALEGLKTTPFSMFSILDTDVLPSF